MQAAQQQTEHSASSSSEGKPQLVAVPPMKLQALWPHIGHLFAEVVARPGSGWTLESMVDNVLAERWQLWMVWNGKPMALCATELGIQDDGAKVCHIRWCTGEGARDFVPVLLPPIEAWAREEGCIGMKAVTRKGWARHLGDYKMTHVLLEKAL